MSDSCSNEGSSFDSKSLGNLAKLPTEELYRLEKELSNEFKSTSKKYVESRLSRIYHMTDALNSNIKEFGENEKNWLKIFNFEIDTINSIKTNTEDLILSKSNLGGNRNIISNFDEYEKEVQEIFKSLRSPLDFDEYLSIDDENDKLPFQKQFKEILTPYANNLKCLMNEKSYQVRLINRSIEANSVILWKEYYRKIINHKNELLSKAYEELNELHKEYYNINQNEIAARNWKSYHRSVIGPSSLKRAFDTDTDDKIISTNHDSHYSVDNEYFQKNKIELTNIKYSYLERLSKFEASQQRDVKNKRIKLNSCLGLTDGEIDNDLELIRSNVVSSKKDLTAVFAKDAEEKDALINQEKEDVEELHNIKSSAEELEEVSLMKKYRKLLSGTKYSKSSSLKTILDANSRYGSNSVFYIPEVPPLESFPELNRAKKVN